MPGMEEVKQGGMHSVEKMREALGPLTGAQTLIDEAATVWHQAFQGTNQPERLAPLMALAQISQQIGEATAHLNGLIQDAGDTVAQL